MLPNCLYCRRYVFFGHSFDFAQSCDFERRILNSEREGFSIGLRRMFEPSVKIMNCVPSLRRSSLRMSFGITSCPLDDSVATSVMMHLLNQVRLSYI